MENKERIVFMFHWDNLCYNSVTVFRIYNCREIIFSASRVRSYKHFVFHVDHCCLIGGWLFHVLSILADLYCSERILGLSHTGIITICSEVVGFWSTSFLVLSHNTIILFKLNSS